MSTIAIIGAHGKIARQLTRRLSEAGDRVLGVIRDPAHSDDIRSDGGTSVLHDLEAEDSETLAAKIGDADAVVFAAGAGAGSGVARKQTVDLGGSLQSIDAAKRAGITRFVQISFIGAQDPVPQGTDEVFAAYWEAKRAADEALRDSELDWTIVKPGGLTDDPGTSRGTVALSGTDLNRGVKTRRADVAEFIQIVLAEDASIGKDLDLAEGDRPLAEALAAALRG